MAYQIGGTNAIDNNRKGLFTGVNLGSYTPGNRPSASTGDIIYNSTLKSIEVYDGSTWRIAGGGGGTTPFASGGQVWHASDIPSTTGAKYYYHVFSSTGSFTCNQLLGVSVLCVGGGGAGGGQTGGGGGGGMMVAENALSLSAGTYTVTVGAGGAGSSGTGGSGGSSSFGNQTTATGGGGGGGGSGNGANGANGGGGGGNTYGNTSGGSGQQSGVVRSPNSNLLGTRTGGGGFNLSGGGGAGCGANGGAAPQSSNAGNSGSVPAGYGGAGAFVPWMPNGITGRIAGGGGGGRNGNARPANYAAGADGGGQGKSPNCVVHGAQGPATVRGSGSINSGGGGGGGAQGGSANQSGGNGGSGLVVVRYYTGGNNPNTAF